MGQLLNSQDEIVGALGILFFAFWMQRALRTLVFPAWSRALLRRGRVGLAMRVRAWQLPAPRKSKTNSSAHREPSCHS